MEKINMWMLFYMDLSKASDTINHDLMIPKLETYGFFHSALSYMPSYLNIDLKG